MHVIALGVGERTEATPKLRLNGVINKQAAAPQGRPDDVPQNTCRLEERVRSRYNKEGERVWGERWEKGEMCVGREKGERRDEWERDGRKEGGMARDMRERRKA